MPLSTVSNTNTIEWHHRWIEYIISVQTRCVCETGMPPVGIKVWKVKATRSLTLMLLERASLLNYAPNMKSLCYSSKIVAKLPLFFFASLQSHRADKTNIVAAFRGMHVSSAKHSYAWLPRKLDYWTDRRTDAGQHAGQSDPLCTTMLRRRHKNQINNSTFLCYAVNSDWKKINSGIITAKIIFRHVKQVHIFNVLTGCALKCTCCFTIY